MTAICCTCNGWVWCVRVFGGRWPTPCFRIAPFTSTPSGRGVPPSRPNSGGNCICHSLCVVSCRLCPLLPSYHTSHKSLVLLFRALPKMPSFYLCFQETILASTIRLLLYSSPQHPRQASAFQLLLGSDSSEPLKMGEVGGVLRQLLII